MRDDEWQQAFNAGRAEADRILYSALRQIETAQCVTDWGDQPHEQMMEYARAVLAKYREGR